MAKTKTKTKREVAHIKATYDAASTTTNNQERWKYTDALSANDANSLSVRQTLYHRARYEAANNSYCAGIIETVAEDTIGTGPRLNFKSEDPIIKRLNTDWLQWINEINLPKKMRIMRSSKMRDGEVFGLKVYNKKVKNSVKLDLQLLEPQWVSSHFNSNAAIDGVWIDEYGNPEYYNILTATTVGGSNPKAKGNKTSANKVIHYAFTTRPQQIRGIPEITPALELFVQLRAYTLSVLSAAETAANFSAVLKTDSSADDPSDVVDALTTFTMERNMMKALPYGWEMQQLKAEQPTTSYKEFKGEILNEIARCIQVPFNVAAGNSSGYNFSSGRLDFLRYFKSISVERSYIEKIILEDLFNEYVAEWKLINGLKEIDTSHFWVWDGHQAIDPVKTANAQKIRMNNKTSNLAIECAIEGTDWLDVLEQRLKEEKAEFDMRQTLGLPQYDKKEDIIIIDEDSDGK